ncbi:MAG: hypothetical protein KAI47_22180 [Deltaproteobacteria bacterium]|nr:hypothetical protein [Deltaproteobacteria bacterium]
MRRVLSAAIAFAALLLIFAPLSGCLQDDIGVHCDLVVDPENPSTQFNLQALDCESRVCLSYQTGSAGPRCTLPCKDDSDCPSDGVAGCPKFVCRIGQVVGSIKCCKFCVCDTDADANDNLTKACSGVGAQCPNI